MKSITDWKKEEWRKFIIYCIPLVVFIVSLLIEVNVNENIQDYKPIMSSLALSMSFMVLGGSIMAFLVINELFARLKSMGIKAKLYPDGLDYSTYTIVPIVIGACAAISAGMFHGIPEFNTIGLIQWAILQWISFPFFAYQFQKLPKIFNSYHNVAFAIGYVDGQRDLARESLVVFNEEKLRQRETRDETD